MPSNLAIDCSEQPMVTEDIKVLLASLLFKLVFKMGPTLLLQHNLPNTLVSPECNSYPLKATRKALIRHITYCIGAGEFSSHSSAVFTGLYPDLKLKLCISNEAAEKLQG